MKINKTITIVVILTLIGFILRIYRISDAPPSLNWDEVSHGWNAYSILKTGMDEWGNRFPLIFRAFGDFKLPVYVYLSVIPVAIFGLSAFSVRLVSVLAGTIAIPLIYLLTKELFSVDPRIQKLKTNNSTPVSDVRSLKSNESLGLIASFLLAFLPWHFFISRPALEANLSLTLILAGSLFLIKSLNRQKLIIPAAIFLGISLHTYNTARVFVPILLLAFTALNYRKIKVTKIFVSGVVIFFLFLALVGWQVFNGEGTARYFKLAILSDTAVYDLGQKRLTSSLPSILPKLIYNRPVYFATEFIKNYLNFFTPGFINQSNNPQSQFAIPNSNLFTYPTLFLFLIGLFYLIKNILRPKTNDHRPTTNMLLLAWLLLSPVAAAITQAPPQALRPNPMIPVIVIISAFGTQYLYRSIARHNIQSAKIFTSVILLVTVISFASYVSNYFGSYRVKFSQSWQWGEQQVMEYVRENQDKYTKIFITKRYGEPHIFYAFYNQIDPKSMFPGNDNIRFKQSDWYWTDRIGKVYFINDWQIPTTPIDSLKLESGGNIPAHLSLLITSPDHIPANCGHLKTIIFIDGTPDYEICSIP